MNLNKQNDFQFNADAVATLADQLTKSMLEVQGTITLLHLRHLFIQSKVSKIPVSNYPKEGNRCLSNK
jgi:hypothetical protein